MPPRISRAALLEHNAMQDSYISVANLFSLPGPVDQSFIQKHCALVSQHLSRNLPCCRRLESGEANSEDPLPSLEPTVGGRFFLTFTLKPELPGLQSHSEQWISAFRRAVIKQLQRQIITSGSYVFEHVDLNCHCHAYVTSNYNITRKHFESVTKKFGYVDLRRVTHDNGVEEYMGKEHLVQSIPPRN